MDGELENEPRGAKESRSKTRNRWGGSGLAAKCKTEAEPAKEPRTAALVKAASKCSGPGGRRDAGAVKPLALFAEAESKAEGKAKGKAESKAENAKVQKRSRTSDGNRNLVCPRRAEEPKE